MSNQATIKNILAQISALSFEDQRMVNSLLVANLKASQKEAARDVAMDFRIGQTVQFDAGPRKGGITRIQITGFSRDLSSIKGTQVSGLRTGVNWTVGATFCKAI